MVYISHVQNINSFITTVSNFWIFTNPLKDQITVRIEDHGNIKLKVFSLLGEELHVASLAMGESTIDMTSYNGNAFILKFISDKGIVTKKVFRIRD